MCLQRLEGELVGVTVGDDDGRDVAERLRGEASVDTRVVGPGVEQQRLALPARTASTNGCPCIFGTRSQVARSVASQLRSWLFLAGILIVG